MVKYKLCFENLMWNIGVFLVGNVLSGTRRMISRLVAAASAAVFAVVVVVVVVVSVVVFVFVGIFFSFFILLVGMVVF